MLVFSGMDVLKSVPTIVHDGLVVKSLVCVLIYFEEIANILSRKVCVHLAPAVVFIFDETHCNILSKNLVSFLLIYARLKIALHQFDDVSISLTLWHK